jgi:MYXO-CTERM domain-containing protein
MKFFVSIVFTAAVLATPFVWAVTPTSSSGTTDDATVSLEVYDEVIIGDSNSHCTVRIEDEALQVALTEGDTVYVWVYEDDILSDDLIWSTDFTVTSAEETAMSLDRTFDCSGDLGDDGLGDAEYYAEARVEKSQCGFACIWDRPQSANVYATELSDDMSEENDDASTATPATLGLSSDYISADQDWFGFTTTQDSRVQVEIRHDPTYGRLDVTLLDSNGGQVAGVTSSDETDHTFLSATQISAGDYRLRVSPRTMNDFNFYDAYLDITTVLSCSPGAIESRNCGNCGNQERTCASNGTWDLYGPCGNQGECSPGATESRACEGIGREQRTCETTCSWGTYGECAGVMCTGMETQACFTGLAVNRSVGTCKDGEQTCSNGEFGACVGEVLPARENCSDNLDNDCDGNLDAADPDCAAMLGQLGAACADRTECIVGLECYVPPSQDAFLGGYCTRTCTTATDCEGGVCGSSGGDRMCLQSCSAAGDCRAGYLCSEFSDGRGCVPKCTKDSHCAGDKPVCNTTSGVCEASTMPTNNTNTNNMNTNNMNTNTSNANNSNTNNPGVVPLLEPGIPEDDGCGCATQREVRGWWALPFAILLLGARRRRRMG